MTDIQIISLEIFKKYKELCERHHLSYFAIGGTCIGAVRHHGFIPWDDDMDIVMPYTDYVNFIRLAQEELDSKYEIFDERIYFIKLCDSDTTFIEAEHRYNYHKNYRGVGIDIGPVFGMERGEDKQTVMAKKNDFYVNMHRERKINYYNQRTLKRKIAWRILEPLGLYRGYKYWAKRSFREFSKIPFDCSDKIMFAWRNLPSPTYHYQSVFDYKDFETYIEMPFEDTVMRVPVGYDGYLRKDFGDYMTLPPEKERIPSHTEAIIDLHNSYKTYLGKL